MKKNSFFHVTSLVCCIILIVSAAGCSGTGTGPKIPEVQRINGKPAGKSPLIGAKIDEGIRLVNKNKIYLISLLPQLEILSVYPNPHTSKDKIIINKEENILYLYKNGELYKIYPVATGKKAEYTPEGEFNIARKVKNEDNKLPPQLGDYWMGLSVPTDKDNQADVDSRAPEGYKYGIHGTNEPESIGKHASGGCIRMKNEQVEEVFNLVTSGTSVEIKGNI